MSVIVFETELLVDRVQQEHDLVKSSFQEAVAHAIQAGELLLELRSGIPHGQWTDWLSRRLPGITIAHATTYMRMARHRELIQSEPSLNAARRALARADTADTRVDPVMVAECIALRGGGAKYKEIAETLSISIPTVSRILNPKAAKQHRRAQARTSKAARRALRLRERDARAKRVGGDLGKAYSLLRQCLDTLQSVEGSHGGEVAIEVRSAMRSLYNAEDSLDQAMKAAY